MTATLGAGDVAQRPSCAAIRVDLRTSAHIEHPQIRPIARIAWVSGICRPMANRFTRDRSLVRNQPCPFRKPCVASS
jgi:hypothetical protein